MSVRSANSDVAHMSGVDRIYSGAIGPTWPTGTVCVDAFVSPGIFKRLALVARAYQRIRYVRLRFRVEPQMSTATSGGYIVGFVRDPADKVTTLDGLTAQQGSVTTKWWQSAVIDATPPQRLFYTSDSAEVREYCPGRLVLIVDGVATQTGSFTIFCEWKVELTSASLEEPKDVSVVTTTKKNLYIVTGKTGLWGDKAGTIDHVDQLLSGAVVGHSYKLPYPVTIPSTSNNGRVAHWLKVNAANATLPCYESVSDTDGGVQTVDNLFLPAGTPLEDATPTPVQGEELAPSSSVFQTTMAESPEQSNRSVELCKELLRALATLTPVLSASTRLSDKSCQNCQLPQDPSDSGANS